MIFHHVIRMQDIRTDLVPPRCLAIFTAQLQSLLTLFFDLTFEQPTTGLRPWKMWATGTATGRVGA